MKHCLRATFVTVCTKAKKNYRDFNVKLLVRLNI